MLAGDDAAPPDLAVSEPPYAHVLVEQVAGAPSDLGSLIWLNRPGDLDTVSALALLHDVALEGRLPAGTTFEAFVYADRVLGSTRRVA